MKLSEFKKLVDNAVAEHGDTIEILGPELWDIHSIKYKISAGEFDEDWDMPTGYEYLVITDCR